MGLQLLALCALAGGPGSARFEESGVRLDGAVVTDAALVLRAAGDGFALVSRSAVESLGAALRVEIAPGRALLLEPGVRLARVDGGFRLTSYGKTSLLIAAEGFARRVDAPAALETDAEGWIVGSVRIPGEELTAGLRPQDDETDRLLDQMERAAERARASLRNGPPDGMRRDAAPGRRMRRVFGVDPEVANEATSSKALKTLTQVSPVGF